MDKELDDLLVKKFPNLYRDRYGDMRSTCMMWGFTCGNGWFLIIYNLSEKLEKIIMSLPIEQRVGVKASQCKEKYGRLRFYMSMSYTEIDKAISEAEKLSAIVCEDCGAPGKMRKKSGWYYTSCDLHAKETTIPCQHCGVIHHDECANLNFGDNESTEDIIGENNE